MLHHLFGAAPAVTIFIFNGTFVWIIPVFIQSKEQVDREALGQGGGCMIEEGRQDNSLILCLSPLLSAEGRSCPWRGLSVSSLCCLSLPHPAHGGLTPKSPCEKGGFLGSFGVGAAQTHCLVHHSQKRDPLTQTTGSGRPPRGSD